MIKTTRELLLICFSASVTGTVGLLLMAAFTIAPYPPPAIVYVPGFLTASVLGLALLFGAGASDPPVDIWALQQRLMGISGQRTPRIPRLTNESVLYLALTAEELGEAATTMSRILARQRPGEPRTSDLSAFLYQVGHVLNTTATDLKDQITQFKTHPIDRPLTLPDAIALLDDAVDITVVAAGLALASGLPAREGYVEVQASNDSKKNPATGVIDKTPDGKWIKGEEFRTPNLGAVIQRQWVDQEYEGHVAFHS